jgi:serine/threonine-protein kinase RsbT
MAHHHAPTKPADARSVLLVEDEIQALVTSEADIVRARQKGRALAVTLGFSASEATLIATVISELARNIVLYAGQGEVIVKRLERGARTGVSVVARDEGPGIPDIDHAMQAGYSTSRGPGLGLPAVRHLMDEFEIVSEVGKGTCVTVRKWTRRTSGSAMR